MADSIELLDDEVLLRRYAEADDREALDLLFRRHVNIAYATALRLCRNAADAEDAVQTAFMQVMKHASSYRGGRGEHGVRMWIIRTVANAGKMKIRGEVRRRQREELVVEDRDDFQVSDNPEGPEADLREQEHEVLAALDQLPDRFRSAIWLHLCQGLPRAEAAAALGLPERTLDNQVQYGMKKLRQMLAGAGISTRLASLSALLPVLSIESAPPSLLASAARLAHSPPQARGAGSMAKAKGGFGGLLSKVAFAGILVAAAGVGVARFAGRQEPRLAPSVSPVNVSTRIDYQWSFNAPGLPSQLQVVEGTVQHVPDGGPDKKGCLQLDAEATRILLDVPMTALPVVVKWKSSVVITPRDRQFVSKVNLFPIHDVAQFMHVGGQPRAFTPTPGQRQSPWYSHVDYFTDSYIERWTDGARVDLTVARPDSNATLMLCFQSAHQLDELIIQSVPANDLPNVDAYLKAIERVPRDKRTGRLPMPDIRFDRPDRPGASVVVDFYEKVEAANWNPLFKQRE